MEQKSRNDRPQPSTPGSPFGVALEEKGTRAASVEGKHGRQPSAEWRLERRIRQTGRQYARPSAAELFRVRHGRAGGPTRHRRGVAALGTANYHDFGVYARFRRPRPTAGVIPALRGGDHHPDRRPAGRRHAGQRSDESQPDVSVRQGDHAPRSAHPRRGAPDSHDAGSQRRSHATDDGPHGGALRRRAGLEGGTTDRQIAASGGRAMRRPIEWVSLQERHVAKRFRVALPRSPGGRSGVPSWAGCSSAGGVDTTDAVAVQEAIRSNLMKAGKPAFVPGGRLLRRRLPADRRAGRHPLLPDACRRRVADLPIRGPARGSGRRLLRRGIYCAELIPGRNRRKSSIDTWRFSAAPGSS